MKGELKLNSAAPYLATNREVSCVAASFGPSLETFASPDYSLDCFSGELGPVRALVAFLFESMTESKIYFSIILIDILSKCLVNS